VETIRWKRKFADDHYFISWSAFRQRRLSSELLTWPIASRIKARAPARWADGHSRSYRFSDAGSLPTIGFRPLGTSAQKPITIIADVKLSPPMRCRWSRTGPMEGDQAIRAANHGRHDQTGDDRPRQRLQDIADRYFRTSCEP